MTLLSVEDLHTHFVARTLDNEVRTARALNGVTFTLEAGRALGIVGETGAGKSLTAHSVMGLLRPPARIVQGRDQLADARLADRAHPEHPEDGDELRLEDLLILGQGRRLPPGATLIDPRRREGLEGWRVAFIRPPLAPVARGQDLPFEPDGFVPPDPPERLLPEAALDVIPPELIPRARALDGH